METLSRAEHDEFAKRMDDWNRRQDKRIELLEEDGKRFANLSNSIAKLATNMELMCKEQKKQGERLEALENKPLERMQDVGATVRTAFITAVISCAVSVVITWAVTTL